MATEGLNLDDLMEELLSKSSPKWITKAQMLSDEFLEHLFFVPPSSLLPANMRALVHSECDDLGIEPPACMMRKDVEYVNYFGGYTAHPNSIVRNTVENGIGIYLVYGSPRMEGSDQEYLTLLHELAHWSIQKPEEGHSVQFYAELTRLCLKYSGNFEMMQQHESWYQGDTAYRGIEFYDSLFNRGELVV